MLKHFHLYRAKTLPNSGSADTIDPGKATIPPGLGRQAAWAGAHPPPSNAKLILPPLNISAGALAPGLCDGHADK